MAASVVSPWFARLSLTVTCGQEKNRKFLDSSVCKEREEEDADHSESRMKLAFQLDKTKIAVLSSRRGDVRQLNRSIVPTRQSTTTSIVFDVESRQIVGQFRGDAYELLIDR